MANNQCSGYGNWTDQGWNLRFHGNVYKQPNINESKLDDLANIFLIDTSVESLPPPQASQARNLTSEIFVLQQDNQNVTFQLAPAPAAGASGEQGGGGAVTPSGGNQTINFPDPTTIEGDFDAFVQINDNGLSAGNTTSNIQRLNVYTQGDINGNATAYLVPGSGLTVISDIDDILRITKIYQPKEGLLNSFARPFVPWMNMPDIYANWSRSIPNFHFHYLTTTPEQITRNYMDFIYKTYPGGSFDTRPLNFSDVSATLSIRKFLLEKIFQTYPKRKFVLVADTSNPDVMRDYPAMATEFPGQVQCIFLRNTSETDPGDKFPYDTSGFKDLDISTYMFFDVPVGFSLSLSCLLPPYSSSRTTPTKYYINNSGRAIMLIHVQDDLTHLDIANGQCVNSTIKQTITFSTQGLPFGLSKSRGATNFAVPPMTWVAAAAVGAVVWMALGL